ncbi:hypothetical protein HZA87_04520 [Candidatus Uhrbacteria bacterium]|nr:hypothetical protein [Candidatus Uhrbacteria bacterium]
MVRLKFTLIVFQEGQPEEEVQTIVEFESVEELAQEMARLAAHNSIVFTHPMIQRIERPSKIIARVNTRRGIDKGTTIVIKNAQELPVAVPPELLEDQELLFHTAAARQHAARVRNSIN